MSKKSLFLQIDNYLFKQMDEIKSSTAYQKLTEQISLIDDEVKNVLNNIIAVILVLIPFIFILGLYYINDLYKQELSLKQEIYNVSNKVIAQRRAGSSAGSTVFSNQEVNSQVKFQNELSTVLSRTRIDPTKVSVTNFDYFEPTPYLGEASMTLNFKGLTLYNFTDLNQALILKKYKIKETQFEVNRKDRLLYGQIALVYYSKFSQGTSP